MRRALHSSFNGEPPKSHRYRRRRTCYLLISASIPPQLAEWRKIRNSTLASRGLITRLGYRRLRLVIPADRYSTTHHAKVIAR